MFAATLAVTPDGAYLLVVNPDSTSLTTVDTAAQVVIIELAVGTDPPITRAAIQMEKRWPVYLP